jgi:hypothetical protein
MYDIYMIIYILYSDILKQGYIGSTTLKLNRRLTFHKNDYKKKFNLSCTEILSKEDYKIDEVCRLDEEKTYLDLLKLESDYIFDHYKNKKLFTFKNNDYEIVNKKLAFKNPKFLCECCNKYLTKKTIKKHNKKTQ